MAIEKNSVRKDNASKFDYPSAYVRVVDVEIRTSSDDVRINVSIYPDKESRDLGGLSISKTVERISFTKFKEYLGSSLDTSAIKAAAYRFLKVELPDKYFGIDC